MSKRTYEEYIENDCHPVGYNEPCQSYSFGQTSVDILLTKIDELKEKLSNKMEELHIAYCSIEDVKTKNSELKVRLEEKDKEIERLQQVDDILFDSYYNTFKTLKQIQTQLAIQELEKVKVNLKDRISMMKNEEHSYLQKVVAWYDICDQINQQIKELKGAN